MKLIIAGGPRTGKTTLSNNYERVVHTDDLIPLGWARASRKAVEWIDDLIPLGWARASRKAVEWIDDPEIQVVEGVAAPRVLRKRLRVNKTGKPCDKLVYLTTTFENLTPDQTVPTTAGREN